jgi:hypothetical protein
MSGKNIMTKFAILIQFLQARSDKSCELSHNIFATHAQTWINQQMLHLFWNMLFNLLVRQTFHYYFR